jgi:hypothetical protein
MGVLSCANGTTDPDGGGYDVTVTITGIPDDFIGLECEIEVNLEAIIGWVGVTIYEGKVTGTTMTAHYDLTEEEKLYMKNFGVPYNPNGTYWIEFDIDLEEAPYYIDLVTPTAIKFSSGKATVDLSDFVDR